MYQDKILTCKECGREFIWTAGEQEFYAKRGFANEPKRCKECRETRKKNNRAAREMYDTICSACGKPCKVPFRPTENRPIYCSECFTKMKHNPTI